jgi:hypothetical protein
MHPLILNQTASLAYGQLTDSTCAEIVGLKRVLVAPVQASIYVQQENGSGVTGSDTCSPDR